MKKALLIVCIACLLLINVAGCQKSAQKPMENQPQAQPNSDLQDNAPERRIIANRISKSAEGVAGVEKASVVVYEMDITSENAAQGQNEVKGMNVIVGITLDMNQSQDKKAKEVEQKVAEKIKQSETGISSIMVTTDPEIIKQINRIATGIIDGNPIKNYQQEIDSITQQLKSMM